LLPRLDPLALDPPAESPDPRARLADRLPDGICELDLEGRLTFINARACELLDRDRGELLHRDPFEMIPWLEGLLPRSLPQIGGLHTAARYRPAVSALDVGGDFYDLIALDDTTAVAVVSDVQGHSVPAAALMGQVRTAVHTHAQVGTAPSEILARTNRLLKDLNTELFTSCLCAQLDLRRRTALLANAGHLPPVLRRPDGRAEVLELPPGLLLGVEAEASFPTTEIALAPGTLLALYTDGLVERPDTDAPVRQPVTAQAHQKG